MAYREGPSGFTECTNLAPFVVERLLDTSMPVCSEHLGSVLLHAKNVLWPPSITWEGLGDKPANSFTADQEEERDRAIKKMLFGDEDSKKGD
jgi:hypothetical protein